jgi:ASC-1-like (ASCH) protein
MTQEILNQLVNNFDYQGEVESIRPFGSGHINDTFQVKIKGDDTQDYLLQRVNHEVFPNVPKLMENMERVTSHIRSKLEARNEPDLDRKGIILVPAKDGKTFICDEKGNYWRLSLLIKNSTSFDQITDPRQATQGGTAFASFMGMLEDLPGEPLFEVIPNFHNVELRLNTFREVVKKNPENRVESISEEIEFIESRAYDMCRILRLGAEGKLPVRITHNDTKFNNLLFDSKTQKPLCVIDLDTVMPGYSLYDYGDAIRTGTNTGAEDDANLDNVTMSMELFEAYSRGFITEGIQFLNETEVENMPHAAKLFPYLIGLRFLTDYIDGDNYFKVAHEHHNLQRARAQFKLVQSMEEQFEQMQKSIQNIYRETKEKVS